MPLVEHWKFTNEKSICLKKTKNTFQLLTGECSTSIIQWLFCGILRVCFQHRRAYAIYY